MRLHTISRMGRIGATERAAIYELGDGHGRICFTKSCTHYYGVYDHGRIQMTIDHGHVVSLNCAAPGGMAGHGCPKKTGFPSGVQLQTRIPFGAQLARLPPLYASRAAGRLLLLEAAATTQPRDRPRDTTRTRGLDERCVDDVELADGPALRLAL
jgi:hypothetical protein